MYWRTEEIIIQRNLIETVYIKLIILYRGNKNKNIKEVFTYCESYKNVIADIWKSTKKRTYQDENPFNLSEKLQENFRVYQEYNPNIIFISIYLINTEIKI